jgi:hypothetical protein
MEHSSGHGSIAVTENKIGVLIAGNPHDNLVTASESNGPSDS